MRCRNCDYRLWNLVSRQCPECGQRFVPSQYEFVANSVQFCCPNCDQAYYGTGEYGHLVPDQFRCLKCDSFIRMNDMVLRPTHGVEEEQTGVERMPWLERQKLGAVRAWFKTVGMALVRPGQLIRLVPANSPAGDAYAFAILTYIAIALATMLPFMLLAVGVGGGPGVLFGAAGGCGYVCVGTLAVGFCVLLWTAITHGVLLLTGSTAGTIERTVAAILYSIGAFAFTAIPCIGAYFGWIWWVVSAIIMVNAGQKVSGLRAAGAVLTFPAIVLVGGVSLFALKVIPQMKAVRSAVVQMQAGTQATPETREVANGVLAFAHRNGGTGPAHAIELVTDRDLEPIDLVAFDTLTMMDDVPIGRQTLEDFDLLTPQRQQDAARTVVESMPSGVIAHRVGDFVFTYHGIDLSTADRNLWIVIFSPDPDENPPPAPGETIAVGRASALVLPIPQASFDRRLATQNALRAKYKLPPLPNPRLVTHGTPAVDHPEASRESDTD